MHKLSILLIEDETSVREALIRMLVRLGYDVVGVADGKQGRDALAMRRFDLVITDMLMPESDGIETIQAIREIDSTLPILAISGSFVEGGYSALEDARLLGADGTLPKPFSVPQLVAAIDLILALRRKGARSNHS
jgi:CheY-like chemotaxis protein